MAFNFDIWTEGRFLDVWSIVHLMSGVFLAGIFINFGFSFWTGLGLTTILVILWEIFEFSVGVVETASNIIVDILIGIFGYIGTWMLYSNLKTESSKRKAWLIFKILIVIGILLNIWGWTAGALR